PPAVDGAPPGGTPRPPQPAARRSRARDRDAGRRHRAPRPGNLPRQVAVAGPGARAGDEPQLDRATSQGTVRIRPARGSGGPSRPFRSRPPDLLGFRLPRSLRGPLWTDDGG